MKLNSLSLGQATAGQQLRPLHPFVAGVQRTQGRPAARRVDGRRHTSRRHGNCRPAGLQVCQEPWGLRSLGTVGCVGGAGQHWCAYARVQAAAAVPVLHSDASTSTASSGCGQWTPPTDRCVCTAWGHVHMHTCMHAHTGAHTVHAWVEWRRHCMHGVDTCLNPHALVSLPACVPRMPRPCNMWQLGTTMHSEPYRPCTRALPRAVATSVHAPLPACRHAAPPWPKWQARAV